MNMGRSRGSLSIGIQSLQSRARAGYSSVRASWWALVDQAFVSLGSFGISILLARKLMPSEYGQYALLTSITIALLVLPQCLVSYGLIARGSALDDVAFRRMLPSLFSYAFIMAVVTGSIVGAAVYANGEPMELGIASGAALAASHFQSVSRSALIARQRFREAIVGDCVSYPGQVLFIWYILKLNDVNISIVFAIVALTSAVATSIQLIQLRPLPPYIARIGSTASEFWRLGRWLLVSNVVSAVTFQLLLWTLSYTDGTRSVATYQAAANLVGIVNPIMFTIGNLIVPSVAVAYAMSGPKQARQAAISRSLPAVILASPVLLSMALAPKLVASIVYGPLSPYQAHSDVLRWLVLASAFQIAATVYYGLLNGMAMPRRTLQSQVVAALVAGALGMPLIAYFGVVGAAAGFAAVCAARALSSWLLANRTLLSSPASRAREPLAPAKLATLSAFEGAATPDDRAELLLKSVLRRGE